MIVRRISRLINRLSISSRPNAILWWGSLVEGGATIGDLHAVENLSHRLEAVGFDHIVVSRLPLLGVRKVIGDWHQLPPKLGTIVFVCGPIVDYPPLLEVLDAYRSARTLAVGVSVLANQHAANVYFDDILPRDGIVGTTFDLALARYDSSFPKQASGRADFDAVCFRGRQTEYGPERPVLFEHAERILLDGIRLGGGAVRQINTLIDPETNSEEQVKESFARANVVATTRMHGALYALAYGRAPVAVDQITGGAKVSAMLEAIGWPLSYKADSVDAATICAAFERARSQDIIPIVQRCAAEAIGRSAEALSKAVALITQRHGMRMAP